MNELMKIILLKRCILTLIAVLLFGYGTERVLAQTSPSVLYVPLIGITSVPEPLALPRGAGSVTYHYAVKNFLSEVALTQVGVVDNTCGPVEFVEGDDNGDAKLDYSETWRYTCTTELSKTTQSTATATGTVNTITATHKAYATVVVGSNNPPPLVSIVNITKVAYPLSLPAEGGDIAFTYKVNNPGVVPLSDVTVTDNKCSVMSSKLGDTNANNLLDIDEVWIYTCSTHLTQTTTNTVNVTAFANGLQAVGDATITVEVDAPGFPNVGENTVSKIAVWGILSSVLVALIIFSVLARKSTLRKTQKKPKFIRSR
jgi:hypothetical protein